MICQRCYRETATPSLWRTTIDDGDVRYQWSFWVCALCVSELVHYMENGFDD